MHSLSFWFGRVSAGLASLILVLLLAPSLAADDFLQDSVEDEPLYPNLRVGLGPAWTHNANLNRFRYQRPALPGWETNALAGAVRADMPGQGDMEFDIGPSLTLALGGRLGLPRWLHVEVETGFTWNRLQFSAVDTELDGELWQVPAAVNLTVPWKVAESWEVFGGVGGGVAFGVMDLDSQALPVRDIPGAQNTAALEGQSLSGAATYQAFAGVRYRLKPSSGLSLTYRFRGTAAPSWTWNADLDGAEGEWELETADLYSHSLLLLFDYNW